MKSYLKLSPVHRNLHFIVILFLLLFFPYFAAGQDVVSSLEFGGIMRDYEVYLPSKVQAGMPLILSLHGYSEDFKWYRDYTALHKWIDTAKVILVCPQAINLTWNIGILADPNGTRVFPNVDDVGFISALIDTIYNRYDIDIDSIYCCGFSTGGEMTFVLACQLGHRLAAVASVAGGLYDPAASQVPIKPMPVLQIHGTEEKRYVPYAGRGSMWSVEKTLNYWVKRNQCSIPADTIDLPDIVPEDNCNVQKITFNGGIDNSKVVHYKVIGGGHSWPGSETSFGTEGNKNLDINANTEFLRFFKNYKNSLAYIAYAKSLQSYPTYLNPAGDTLYVNAQIANPRSHSVNVLAVLEAEGIAFSDSIQLFDDGLNNDGDVQDNYWCVQKRLTNLPEAIFKIELKTNDLDEGTSHHCRFSNYITTIGPLCAVNYIVGSYNDRFKTQYFTFSLSNNSSSAKATNVTARITTSDTCVNNINKKIVDFEDIAAGETKQGTEEFSFNYTASGAEIRDELNISFTVNIYSEGIHFWTDSIKTITGIRSTPNNLIEHFALFQNYPNPFNPKTTITYQLPKTSQVDLSIYNILGQKVSTLVNGKQSAGKHEVQWDASGFSSGIYYFQLKAGDFTEVKKMVLLR